MPVRSEVHCLETADEAARSAAEMIAEIAEDRVRRRGCFNIALPGGRTPLSLFETLAAPPFSDRIAWKFWEVYWTDERMVPPDHPASNYGMAREALLDRVPIDPDLVLRIHGEDDPPKAARDYEDLVCMTLRFARQSFDMVLLGMGEDGHVASLFPGTSAFGETDRLVVANWVPALRSYRVTFTLPLINAAKYILFYVTGESKAGAVAEVLAPPQEGGVHEALPAAMVHPAIALHWFLDAGAASRLKAAAAPALAGALR